MGGGIGLMSGASHRVVSERSKLAFPEITVGLFPDVGGSWLLPRVPGNGGLFLALTGALLNPGDEVIVEVEGVGRLVNRIVSEAEFFAQHLQEAAAQ